MCEKMSRTTRMGESEMPTKNTFVHFSEGMEKGILTRVVSCPSIMTDFEHSETPMLSLGKAPVMEDDNCSAASTSGQDSEDNSQGVCSMADAQSSGTWTRYNSPGQAGAEHSPEWGNAEASSIGPRHSSPPNLGITGVATPIMFTSPAPMGQTAPPSTVNAAPVPLGQTMPASVPMPQTAPMHAVNAVAVPVGQTMPASVPMPQTAPMHAVNAVAVQVGQTMPASVPMPQTAPMHAVNAVAVPVGQNMPASVPMPETAPMHAVNAVAVQVGQTMPASVPMPQTAPMHAVNAVAMQVGQTMPASMPMPQTAPMHAVNAAAVPVGQTMPASMPMPQTAPMHAVNAAAVPVGQNMPASVPMPQSAPGPAVQTDQTMPTVILAGLPVPASRQASAEKVQVEHVKQAAGSSHLDVGRFRSSRKQNLALQKRINKDLVLAGKKDSLEVLKVASKNLDVMNGVNLATAFHRIAKDTTDEVEVAECSAFSSMLAAAEHHAEQELAHRDGSLPANCCTIIAWSCAQLRLFKIPLFAKLARVATPRIRSCQPYEVTNLLWAFAEFYKFEQEAAANLSAELRSLLEGVADLFCGRTTGDFKVQVLTSALMSVSALPWDQSFSQTWLFNSTFHELASRWEELAPQGKAHVAVALERLRAKCHHFYGTVLNSGKQKFPVVAAALEAMTAERAGNQLVTGYFVQS